jgi:uncharacterized protein (DUF2062 family)
MFKRRTPRTIVQHIREFFWPSMGWKRFYLYVKNRVLRLNDTPRNVGLGLAFGAAVSFSPFMGTHIIQAVAFSVLFRANILAAPIGTLIGNPWTFPFIWFASLYTGLWISPFFGVPVSADLLRDLSLSNVWQYTTQNPADIIVPWTIGGYILAILSAPLYYLFFSRAIKKLQKARAKLIAR